ncbi:Diaminopropionate ammonia-lyase [Staphylococcus gallinarum]|uniref:Diaminopropionate ammonia-lyase n=1 Tax=Staphylococcus gallinarum TaxID=1293 RepID=A0A380FAY9_STAGA|nr:Diaminopropionate ammonia-lyase [Staphylococcus gallinarum]
MPGKILKPTIQATFSCKDVISSIGMKQYANPLNNDRSIISGESGALPLGVLIEIMTSKALFNAKDSLKLDNSSNILLINTEGNTNPKNYDDIIHNKLF